METIDNKHLFEFIEQVGRPVSMADMTAHFSDVPQIDILRCIASLKEAGWLFEVEQFVWDLTEKSKIQSNKTIEGERQEKIQSLAKHKRTKIELQQALKKLRHYPATKWTAGIVFVIAIGLTVLIVRKWINE
jgi:hypothetical protein